ncbi:MAG: FAD-dependent oxidoreductase [Planctomyces sp.]|nr:FAD-dependent oxidoreductase [Planctomyces sp.]
MTKVDVVIVGQGIAGSCLAWKLIELGLELRIVNDSGQLSSSQVAAGLITPVTGLRLVPQDRFEEYWNEAAAFYRHIESKTGVEIFRESAAQRLFVSQKEKSIFLEREHQYGPFIQVKRLTSPVSDEVVGFRMWPAGRLLTNEYLEATRQYLKLLNFYQEAVVDVDTEIEQSEHSVYLKRLGLEAKVVVLCQGVEGRRNQRWFENVPDAPARGDVLEIELTNWPETEVVHKGLWITPTPERGQNRYLIGATYDREHLDRVPSNSAKDELLEQLARMTDERPRVIRQLVGIRPSTRNRRSIVRFHDEHPRIAVFNGLGSKGSLTAPSAASTLSREIFDVVKGTRNPTRGPVRITQIAQDKAAIVLKPGDTAIDATCGNGHDTLFLAKAVTQSGRVLAFDLQKQAIERTSSKLTENELESVTLLNACHSEITKYQPDGSVSVVMFNLGYLPGGDKSCTTIAETTVKAIEGAVRVLKSDGVLLVTSYRGHAGGLAEWLSVDHLLKNFAKQGHTLEIIDSDRTKTTSPVLFVFTKRDQFVPKEQSEVGEATRTR